MTSKPTAAAFLANMNVPSEPDAKPEVVQPRRQTRAASPPANQSAANRRSSLKHIGGYFDDETVEMVAILRARLKLDNSQLIKRAVTELYAKQKAAKAFGN